MFYRLLLIPFLMSAMLNKLAIAELEVAVTKTQVLSGVKNPKVIQSFVVFDNEGSKPAFQPAAFLTVTTDFKFVRVRARQNLFESTIVVKLSETEYILLGSGKYAVDVTAFDPERGIEEKNLVVDLGDVAPPDPTPTPGPSPSPNTVPDDQFNNIGKRTKDWSKSLEKRKELGALYRQASKLLTDSPIATINDATTLITDSKAKLLGSDSPKYSTLFENLNADLRSRWPLSRMDYALYLSAIATGLEN
jgi:hypothetical protein